MAAAEARAVWQRTANRCFVQEDAKRAPKLACCQSSSKQADSSPIGVAGAHDQSAVGFMPVNRIPSYPNLPSDMRWRWLQLQSSYGPQKGSTNELLNALEEDGVESLKSKVNSPSDISRVHPEDACDASDAGRKMNYEYSLDSAETMKNCEFLEMESIEYDASKKTNDFSYDLGSPWVGGGKAEPWWRMTDKDELASFVARRSLDFIENCDLPPPQKMHVRRYSREHSGSFDGDEVSSSAWKSPTDPVPSPIVNADAQCASNASFSTTEKDFIEQVTESDPSKAQLLEALRHSQTRAREAEKAAKQAYAEKEHVIKLIFKQASQIYAHKQWFKMLQLDALYLQIKNNEQPVSTLFPLVLPWTSCNRCKSRQRLQKTGKGRRGKQSQPRPSITTCAVAFALGLSLVSAGLLLGWTVGRMLPI